MFTDEMVSFLQSGCALIVATADDHHVPWATRGWGLDVDTAERTARLLLGSEDPVALEHLAVTGRIAVTGTSVATLRSVQLKGTVLDLLPPTDDERQRSSRYCEQFFGDIEAVDHADRSLTERLRPADVVVCRFAVLELFDQTPGPSAGAALAGRAP